MTALGAFRFDVEVGGISPAFDANGPQPACLDELGDSQAGVLGRHPIVIGQIGCGRDSVGSGGAIEQFAFGVFAAYFSG